MIRYLLFICKPKLLIWANYFHGFPKTSKCQMCSILLDRILVSLSDPLLPGLVHFLGNCLTVSSCLYYSRCFYIRQLLLHFQQQPPSLKGLIYYHPAANLLQQ